tara:strand:- start:63 stop:599 length:537 start_codon:yes stop_codon:yes gene_type:complete
MKALSDIVCERSFEHLRDEHLHMLADKALKDLEELFTRRPETGELYAQRLLAICLCQGAAEHFVRGLHGIKDLDAWAFFRRHPARRFPPRRRSTVDFGPSELGRNPYDAGYAGRRVDVMGRSIAVADGQNATDAIRSWLIGRRTLSARHIAQRPVVVIHPATEAGLVIWDPVFEGTAR